MENFLKEFEKDSNIYNKKVLLFGAMKDKSIKEMLTLLRENFDEIHITQIDYERACSIEELSKIAGEIGLRTIPEINLSEFILKFESLNNNDCLVVLGSMYLLGAVKSSLRLGNIA